MKNPFYRFLSILTVCSFSVFSLFAADQDQEDSFAWQNRKHFQDIVQKFEAIADRELTSTIGQLIRLIDREKDFFAKRYRDLKQEIQQTAFSWAKKEVLTEEKFREEENNHNVISQQDNDVSDMEEDEDSWRRDFMDGYNRSDSEDEAENDEDSGNTNTDEEMSDYSLENSFYGEEDTLQDLEEDEDAFKEWQLDKLRNMLSIDLKDISEFTPASIHPAAQKQFLKQYVENGYSWLINQVIEGDFSTSEDFVNRIHQETSVPEEVLNSIFANLWFDYDWEEFDYSDPLFLQHTYKKTLEDLISGKRARDVKAYLLNSIHRIFTYNGEDFDKPFEDIIERYNNYAAKRDWRGALIEWSVYQTYRKVFQEPAKRSKVKDYEKPSKAFASIQSFNKEDYLLRRLEERLARTKAYYTKVYPHPTTKFLSYGKRSKAKLNLPKVLSHLKQVGQHFEPHRPRNAENVFVPSLFFVVSAQPDQTGAKKFVRVPLQLPGLPKRPLTKDPKDQVFAGVSDNQYFKQVKKDYVSGKVLQNNDRTKAEEEIDAVIENIGLCGPNLIHSERVFMELSRRREFVKQICQTLAKRLENNIGEGTYKVYGAVLCAYSTNTVCPYCTPTLLTLQNSFQAGGFLSRLVTELNSMDGNVTFYTKGYDSETEMQDWSKFHLNTFVTANTKFDPQARDLADQGLFFPEDTIDLSLPLLDQSGNPQAQNPFFYEFVGEELHKSYKNQNPYFKEKGNLTYNGVILSSGSKAWGHGLMH